MRQPVGGARERGASAVEFALVIPVLLVVIFGILQVAMIFAQTSALANAARSGARTGSVDLVTLSTCEDVLSATRDQALSLGMNDKAQVEVTVARGDVSGDVKTLLSTPVCKQGAGQAATGNLGAAPCTTPAAETDPQKLVVQATYDAVISVPFVPEMRFPRSVSGVYRCEYR